MHVRVYISLQLNRATVHGENGELLQATYRISKRCVCIHTIIILLKQNGFALHIAQRSEAVYKLYSVHYAVHKPPPADEYISNG